MAYKDNRYGLTAETLRTLFSYDEDTKGFFYAHKPYRKPHLLGRKAGHIDQRDGVYYVGVKGHTYPAWRLAVLYKTGEWPPQASEYARRALTHERLTSMLAYDPEAGVFTRKSGGFGIKIGARADYLESCGYRYVKLDGTRYLAARLAWFYVNQEWPRRVLRFQDGNSQNCALANLAYGEFHVSTPEGRRQYERHNRQKKPALYRAKDIQRDFGIPLEEYQRLFVGQNGVCAVCGQPETEKRNGKTKWLAIDHDHSDGTLRGLLCTNCNNGLGRFKDDPATLRNAAAYLESHAAKKVETNVIRLSGRAIHGKKGSRL